MMRKTVTTVSPLPTVYRATTGGTASAPATKTAAGSSPPRAISSRARWQERWEKAAPAAKKLKKVLICAAPVIGSLALSCSPIGQITPVVTTTRDTPPAVAKADWETKWEQLAGEAKKEGQVVIYAGFSGPVRIPLAEAFKQKYGVELDITVGRGAEIAEKIIREDRAGLRVADVIVDGRPTIESVLTPAGVLGSLEPLLSLPEVKDPQAWWGGALPWTKDKLIFPATSAVIPPLVINTSMVKTEEVSRMTDLLDPRWRGKIAMDDVTIGLGLNWFAVFSEVLGYDYMKALAKMEPAMTADKRLLAEWIAKGKYPVGIMPSEIVTEFIQLGAPLTFVIPKEGAHISAGSGAILFVAKAPHPNAAKLFINWLLSREGQTVFSRASGLPSARIDVPKDHILPIRNRQPGVNYFIPEAEELLQALPEKQKMAREIFAPFLVR